MASYSPLLDLPPYPADGYGRLADRLKALMGTRNDVVFVQGEAILALEAVATSLTAPERVILNVVSSPYGDYFGQWLNSGLGVNTHFAEPGLPVGGIGGMLDQLSSVDLVALVHAETSSGIVNPLSRIAADVNRTGALLIVDAVASIGGHPLDVDALGIDVCVIGPQKALGGPAGVSAMSVSPRAWAAMATHPSASPSSLSLLDLKRNWLDKGRGALPGMPSAIEFWALEAALDRVEAETLPAVIARHVRAARATRAGLRAMGAELWIVDEAEASTLVTAVRVPAGIDASVLVDAARKLGAIVALGFGAIASQIVRLDHTGQRANIDAVLANVLHYGTALAELGVAVDLDAGARAIVASDSHQAG